MAVPAMTTSPPPISQIAAGMDQLPLDQQREIVAHILLTRGPVDAAALEHEIELNQQEKV